MKMWDMNGKKVTDINKILNPWGDGAQYIMVEDALDLRIIKTIMERLNYSKLYYVDSVGLYRRADCDNFRKCAPVLEAQ